MNFEKFYIGGRSFLAAVLLLFAFQTAEAGVFNPETFTLKNGMQVVVISNHRAPIVRHMVWYKVGAADEPRGKSGIAHFFEHLMFKKTTTLKSGEFSRIIAKNGGRDNAFTSHDYTGYHQSIAVDRLGIVMKLEADRMRGLILEDDQIEPERQVVLEERRSRTDNSPGAKLSEQMSAAMFINYPYHDPVIGWEHEIKALTKADLMKFYDQWYRPNNAILVVAGDITAAQLRPLAEKYYGSLPRGADVKRERTIEPPHNAAIRVTLRDARVRQPSIRRRYLAPSLLYGERGHVYPLEVLAQVFGGGTTSTLYRSLVIKQKLAVSAGAFYDGDNRGPSTFGFYASPRPGVGIEKLEAALDKEIAKLLDKGIDAKNVARAINTMQSEAIYARDSIGGGARVIGSALAAGHTIADVEEWPERISAVTKEQIDAAAKAILQIKNSVTGLLLNKKKKGS
ncbi:MAG: insulinase family protein [Rhodospirillaceae bacterium]|jgi:zinc protease|nr:insulinase family protein [Rhodospirillaceae bacterium]MBT4588875.1 insulinase family protein [Rhodospirillaceae bacterium]MBT4939486.1 insulinase family protein [Rhodospirillaceae bacterium]MBT7269016.1 insulinase family protein [Rhodospirillaceae bacterium]